MYVDNIDAILDSTLDDFFKNIIISKKLSDIFKLTNFVEKQSVILKIISGYLSSINLDDIKKVILETSK